MAELEQRLPTQADFRKAPLCTGDPDELFETLNALPGEKVAKVKVGLYEAVRDGMIVNVLLEALPDLRLRLDANRSWSRAKADGFARYVNPAWRDRIAFLEEPARPVMNRAISPGGPASPSPGMRVCVRRTLWCRPNRAWRPS